MLVLQIQPAALIVKEKCHYYCRADQMKRASEINMLFIWTFSANLDWIVSHTNLRSWCWPGSLRWGRHETHGRGRRGWTEHLSVHTGETLHSRSSSSEDRPSGSLRFKHYSVTKSFHCFSRGFSVNLWWPCGLWIRYQTDPELKPLV